MSVSEYNIMLFKVLNYRKSSRHIKPAVIFDLTNDIQKNGSIKEYDALEEEKRLLLIEKLLKRYFVVIFHGNTVFLTHDHLIGSYYKISYLDNISDLVPSMNIEEVSTGSNVVKQRKLGSKPRVESSNDKMIIVLDSESDPEEEEEEELRFYADMLIESATVDNFYNECDIQSKSEHKTSLSYIINK
jgi:hypothetical protein